MLNTLKITQKLHTTSVNMQPYDFIEYFLHVVIEWE
jgi:hypothetical protein